MGANAISRDHPMDVTLACAHNFYASSLKNAAE
jgi:hypothetical protein